jgi:plastocyanin
MPRKTQAHKHKKNSDAQEEGQKGFISDAFKRTMNKNEKIIMGLLVGGIVTFLILSIIVLFGRGGQSLEEITGTPAVTTPTVKVLTTPYPTVPPVTDFLMQVNEKRFYPDAVSIAAGHNVTILNIGSSPTTITPTTQGNTQDFGTIAPGEEKVVMFDKAGVYRYTRTGVPDQILTITVN